MKVFVALLSVLALASATSFSSLMAKNSHYRVSDDSLFSHVSPRSSRIVSGQDAVEGQFPYMVSMRWRGFGHFCGAFAITANRAGTAAHCLEGFDRVYDLEYMSASVDMIQVNEGTEFPLNFFWMHEEYDIRGFMDMDVGVLQINGDFLSTNARLVPLNPVDPPAGTEVVIAGWGALYSGGPSPDTLQWTTVNIVDRDVCLGQYTANVTINNICAAYPERDTCQGDSGGPLFWAGEEGNTVAGIVSWGMGCAHPDFAGVYTAIASPAVYEYLNTFVEDQGIAPY